MPVLVGGLANNASNPGIFGTVKEAISSGLINNLIGGNSQNNNLVSSILSLIFGDKTNALTSTVANFAGIGQGSSNSILNMLTGSTLGSLGKYVEENNVDQSQFSNLLSDQKGLVSGLLPAGLSLGSLGLGSLFDGASETVSNAAQNVAEAVDVTRSGDTLSAVRPSSTPSPSPSSNNDNGGGSIWKWLLPLLLLLAASWFLWKQCGKKADTTTTTVVTDSTAVPKDSSSTVIETPVTATREALVVTLPSGKTINAYKGGIEDQIVTFLKSDEYKNDTEDQLKDKWFNFDNLNFEFGTTKLTPESKVQLDNLKAILGEFPAANIKIGAYTDKKGDAAANLKLSKERAAAVKTALASTQVKEAEGYGAEFAKVPAEATDKEREADRKTAIRFVK